MRIVGIVVLAVALSASAQTPETKEEFEIASIRPDDNPAAGSMRIDIHEGGLFSATAASIKMLIRSAFDIQSFQLEGAPAWLDAVKYDVNAKTAGSVRLTRETLKPLLQSLLADRFGLKYHREMRDLPAYSLTIGRGAPRLTESTGEAAPPKIIGTNNSGNAQITATWVSMADLARELSGQLQSVVFENTGLQGAFDFTLKWSFNPGPESPSPSIFSALQEQLGLKFESKKGPVEVIVIDHVERVPTEN